MDRRDFFGIIAAPLLRNVGPPPTPFARGGYIPHGLTANLSYPCCPMPAHVIKQMAHPLPSRGELLDMSGVICVRYNQNAQETLRKIQARLATGPNTK